jgi:cytosine/uracil/thiamine/allantoin permease
MHTGSAAIAYVLEVLLAFMILIAEKLTWVTKIEWLVGILVAAAITWWLDHRAAMASYREPPSSTVRIHQGGWPP